MASFSPHEIDAIEVAAAIPDPGPAGRAIIASLNACAPETIRYSVRTSIWCAAMTLAYGPGNVHPSRCDADGHPTAETVEAFPEIRESWYRARERLAAAIDTARREARL